MLSVAYKVNVAIMRHVIHSKFISADPSASLAAATAYATMRPRNVVIFKLLKIFNWNYFGLKATIGGLFWRKVTKREQ